MFFQFFCYKMGKSTGLKGKIKKCVVKKFLNFVLYDEFQGTNARKVNCNCVYSAYIWNWAEFVIKNRCISVRLISEEVKIINFDDFENSHKSFLWPEYFIYFCENGFYVRLWYSFCVYFSAQSTLQYKKCVHVWNNFPRTH